MNNSSLKAFAELMHQLYFTYSHLQKMQLLKNYFSKLSDPDRGWIVAILAGTLDIQSIKRGLIIELIKERVDPFLFELSYDYVGDLAETVALLWPTSPDEGKALPDLHQIIQQFLRLDKTNIKPYLIDLLNKATVRERYALIKLTSGTLRIGVSARFVKLALAEFGNKNIHDIERLWHGLAPPYTSLFAWLENKALEPDISERVFFHPVMLANPLQEKDMLDLDLNEYFLERKYDGIRVQIVTTNTEKALYTRSGDEISVSFPDVLASVDNNMVLDGELVIKKDNQLGSFNDLQQRLNLKKVTKKMLETAPAFIILYDILSHDKCDLRHLPLFERRKMLENWFAQQQPSNMQLSEILSVAPHLSLKQMREKILAENDIAVEGLMLKKCHSPYLPGRPVGHWYKWKKDPFTIDAVLMYAQRGHGKRSSFYSDYTFGLWQDNHLLPIGKAYFGFTDKELMKLDRWIRTHTKARFGPVREVAKEMVFEIAFDSVNRSRRHKSGFALRFPRINRIRWDKPASEADHLSSLEKMLG